jgi:hypothetical protein
MMVQRLLILLVNKNNNMKCAIALDINGKISGNSRAFGAKTIASNSTAVVHPRDLSVKNVLPTVSELENSIFPKQLVTYLQTAKPTTTEGLRALGAMEDVESMDQLIAMDNLYKDIADNYFGKTKTGILSPNP